MSEKKLFERKSECCGCGACADACGCGAITMTEDREGFLYPVIDGEKCVGCGACETVCPLKGEPADADAHRNRYYGVKAADGSVRAASSSGGVFSLLAGEVFRNGGIVFGAGFDGEMRLHVKCAENEEELSPLRKTKYVQSDTTGAFSAVRRALSEGKQVLFAGTPCQVEGLRKFIGEADGGRLILCALICYGVPSPGVFRDYLRYLGRKSGGKVVAFQFRDKRNNDSGHTRSYVVRRKDGTEREFSAPLHEDKYCGLYFGNLILRPSCHECRFCTVARNADLTIGDLWGIEKVRPEWDDGRGVSLVIAHSDKGMRMMEALRGEMERIECTEEQIMQPRLYSPTPPSPRRERFMKHYRRFPLGVLFKARAGKNFVKRIVRRR